MLNYTLIRKNNKNLYLRIKDGQIVVTAPYNISKAYIDQFLSRHKSWIDMRLNQQRSLQNLDTVSIFGKSYTICFENRKIRDSLHILYCKKDIKSFQQCIKNVIQELFLQRFLFHCQRMNIKGQKLHIGFYKSKWGSYHPAKSLVCLNGNLAFTDIECLDAIIIHELCHIQYRDHSSDFYNEVLKWMPNYKTVHKRLKTYKIPYIKKDA